MSRSNVEESTIPFIKSIRHVEEVDSTNDLAKRLLDDGSIPLPILIQADRQTRGRGQRSNVWWSDPGSLTATIAFDPATLGLTVDREPMVALVTASAVVDAIAGRYPTCRAGIRWPNDVEVGGRKLGGILSERVETPSGPRHLVGIGLNVQTRLIDAPAEVRRMAATLVEWEETPPSIDPITNLMRGILKRFEEVFRALSGRSPVLVDRWNRQDTLAGSKIKVQVGDELIEGIAAGIDESGGLRLLHEGRILVIHAGRVVRD